MLIAFGISAVNHVRTFRTADLTGRNNGWIYCIYINHYPVVKYIQLPLKISPSGFFRIFYHPSVYLINIFKTVLQQVSACLFTLDATGAIGYYPFILQVFKLFQLFREVAEVVDIQL